jgi:hypothetical protein
VKIATALRELHRAEHDLARELLRLAERHPGDHEIHHLARDLAGFSRRHAHTVEDLADRYRARLGPPEEGPREPAGDLLDGQGDPSLQRLHDLRNVYTMAAGTSVDWELLAQAAQGLGDGALLEVARRCHPDTLRQMRWANARLKESATQILLS